MDAKYKTLVTTLKQGILCGKYAAGKPFPSLRALIGRFGLSKTTVQRALDELVAEGLVSCEQGRGTFVTAQAATRKIGLIVPDHGRSEFFPAIVREISRLAQTKGYTLLFGEVAASTDDGRIRQVERLVRDFINQEVAGVIFQPMDYIKDSESVNRRVLGRFDAAGIPVVLCDYDFVDAPARSPYDVVGVNNVDAGALLVKHLLDRGATKIHFHLKPFAPQSHKSLIRGALHAFQEARGAQKNLVLVSDPDDVAALRKHCRRSRPDAFVCGNDMMAAKLLKSLNKLGYAVPEDILLTGKNDLQIAPILTPPLTTIHLSCEQIAATAFYRLLSRIAAPDLPPTEMYVPTSLVERESTRREVILRPSTEKTGPA